MPDDRLSMDHDAVESMQSNLQRNEPGILASYGLIGAVMLLGGAGFLIDGYLQTRPWGLLGGLLAGLCIGFYQLAPGDPALSRRLPSDPAGSWAAGRSPRPPPQRRDGECLTWRCVFPSSAPVRLIGPSPSGSISPLPAASRRHPAEERQVAIGGASAGVPSQERRRPVSAGGPATGHASSKSSRPSAARCNGVVSRRIERCGQPM